MTELLASEQASPGSWSMVATVCATRRVCDFRCAIACHSSYRLRSLLFDSIISSSS
jgi:hypothetical protein